MGGSNDSAIVSNQAGRLNDLSRLASGAKKTRAGAAGQISLFSYNNLIRERIEDLRRFACRCAGRSALRFLTKVWCRKYWLDYD